MTQNRLTSKELAEQLGVSVTRVQVMLNEECPRCNGSGTVDKILPDEEEHRVWKDGGVVYQCPRCRGTGDRIPHKDGLRTGAGREALIHPWVLDIPDLRVRRYGRGSDPPGVTLEKEGDGYKVRCIGEPAGHVERDPALEGRRRSWMYVDLDGNPSQERYRSARAAAEELCSTDPIDSRH